MLYLVANVKNVFIPAHYKEIVKYFLMHWKYFQSDWYWICRKWLAGGRKEVEAGWEQCSWSFKEWINFLQCKKDNISMFAHIKKHYLGKILRIKIFFQFFPLLFSCQKKRILKKFLEMPHCWHFDRLQTTL